MKEVAMARSKRWRGMTLVIEIASVEERDGQLDREGAKSAAW